MNVNHLLELFMNENKFIYEGKAYKAVSTQGKYDCNGCHFRYGDIDCIKLRKKGMRPPCCRDQRQDGAYVIFITAVYPYIAFKRSITLIER